MCEECDPGSELQNPPLLALEPGHLTLQPYSPIQIQIRFTSLDRGAISHDEKKFAHAQRRIRTAHSLAMQPSTVIAKQPSLIREKHGIALSELLLSLARAPQAGLQRLFVQIRRRRSGRHKDRSSLLLLPPCQQEMLLLC